jgi:probable phosphoglycerate mutase
VILLARHGETDDNRPPVRIQGKRDTPLNDHGRAQARELAERVAGEGVVALHASRLARARETAEIVGERLGLEPRLDERLAETDRGDWEGRTWEEIEREDPTGFAAWRAAGEGFGFPGGETLAAQSARVLAALEDIGQGPTPALVVCHGGSIRVALCHLHGRGLAAFHEWDVPNGALVRL